MIQNFVGSRIMQGSHCFSTALLRITEYYAKMGFTEDMVFGLSGGLDFMYRKDGQAICLNGRANDIEKKYASCLGLSFTQWTAASFPDFIREVSAYLKNGDLLLLYLDASKLPYIRLGLDMQDVAMMSEHAGILCGMDKEREIFFVLDYMLSGVAEVPYPMMEQALYNGAPKQFSPNRPETLKNTYGVYTFPKECVPLTIAVYSSVEATCNHMLNPTNYYQGLFGMRLLAREYPAWKEYFPQEILCKELGTAYAYLEKIGTGGGNFRRMYARFLKEVSVITGNDEYLELSKEYFAVSRLWKLFALNLSRLSESFSDALYDAQKPVVKELYERESELIGKLNHCVQKG